MKNFVGNRLTAQRAHGENNGSSLQPVSWVISQNMNDLESHIAFAQSCIDQGNVK